jgi:GNAT superfamily N-acetyltransferase
MMIRLCDVRDFDEIYAIINDGAQAYKGVLPADCWSEPYMSREQLQHEIDEGVTFWGFGKPGGMLGVMGLQNVKDVALVRHAYVRTRGQNQGIGTLLLSQLLGLADRPVLVGTWAAAVWAIKFYERKGFYVVSPEEKERLLKAYWNVPKRQSDISVVLAKRGHALA